MFYREAGQFKTSYGNDQAVFPIIQDRWFIALVLIVAYAVVPFVADEYWLQAVIIPFLIFSLAAVGLNLLTGDAGQLSLGTGAFMAVGAYATYKITTAFPGIDIFVVYLMSGMVAAGIGVLFGLPSLRIKGFYLAVATLAAQFFILWLFNKVGWFYNDNPSGTITAPPRTFLGIMVTGPKATAETRYFISLVFLTVFALAAKNIVRGRIGRAWMAFAISSFYCGVAGALSVFAWLGSAETEAFDIFVSFQVLFMIIIGGLGSIMGSILGAAFITLVPIFLTNAPAMFNIPMGTDLSKHIEEIVFGGLIGFILIVEPNGFARLWQIAKEKLSQGPFPY